MSTHPLSHIHQGQTTQRGRDEAKSSEEVSSTLKVDVMISPQRCHQQYAKSECTACPWPPSDLLFGSTQSGTDGRGTRHNTASHKRLRSTQEESKYKHLTSNPWSQDRVDTPAWFADVRFKKRERERPDLLSVGMLSSAERSDPSLHHPWRRWPPGWTDRCSAPAPQLPWKLWREAERSSYRGIPDSSPSSLTLMSLESDVYMLSLKV